MKAKHFIQVAVVMMVVVGLGFSATHAATISHSSSWGDRPYPVSNNDLINAGQDTLTSIALTSGTAVLGSLDKLNDGDLWGGLSDPASWETYNACLAPSDGAIVTVALSTVASPFGYDIDSIVTTTGSKTSRFGQKFDLWYSLVATPDTFVYVDGDSGATVNRAGSIPNAQSTITSDIVGSPIATGVAKLQFKFYKYSSSENVYREIDVFGAPVPEPGTLALLATGLIGLLCYAWRKRK